MSKDNETVAFYDREAKTYAADVAPKAVPDILLSFATRLPAVSSVLDLGCGGGWASVAFQDMGHDVIAMDGSESMLAEARKLGVRNTLLDDFSGIDWRGEFDGIWASFSLQHAPRETMPGTLGKIADALKPGGWLYIGIHEGDETVRDPLARLYCHYTQVELQGLLASAGIEIRAVTHDKSTGYDGRPIDCMHIEAQKHG